MASWLGLECTEVRDRGDLAATLRKAVPGRRRGKAAGEGVQVE
jgi:hypothetical protein